MTEQHPEGSERVGTADTLSVPEVAGEKTAVEPVAGTMPAGVELEEAFSVVGRPTAVRAFPRGVNGERRYPEVTVKETTAAARRSEPLAVAGVPADGRLTLTPEETDLHTKRALRLVLDVSALEAVVAGETANLLLPLADGSAVEVRIDRIRDRGGMTHTLEGGIPDEPQSSVVQLILHDGIVHGSLARYDIDQHLEYTILPSGHLAVRELDGSTMTARCGDPGHGECGPGCDGHHGHAEEAAPEESAPGPPSGDDGEPAGDTPGYVTMDVVVGYGREARIADGGVSQIEARIIASVDRMNLAFGNSLVDSTELMLLGTIEDPFYVFPGSTSGTMSSGDELGNLNNLSDGVLDTVSDYATALGADLRAFIVKDADGSAGVAYRPGRSSITARTYMTSNRITFVHELGHNIGARHSWGDSSGDSTTTVHNYGWRLDPPSSGQVRTVMAYDWGWTRIPYFANPLVEYLGARTGQVDGYNATGDPESDPRYVSGGYTGTAGAGFDGSNPALGARNADYLEAQAPGKAGHAVRTSFAVVDPAAAVTWNPATTYEIYWTGGDHTDTATVELFKSGVLDTVIASGVRGDDRKVAWTVPGSQAPGSDYMMRVTLNGSEVADSAFFTIGSALPSVVSQTPDRSEAQLAGQAQISITFSEPMNPATFSIAGDVASFTGPQGADLSGAILGSSWSNGDTVLTVTFTPQSAGGVYRMAFGPDILDLTGNPLDQDGDEFPGEMLEDGYAAIFWIGSGGGSGTIWSDLAGSDALDAGWTFSGGSWQSGSPAETPPNGPALGADGGPILAQNLGGSYNSGENSHAESPSIDCSGWSNVQLSFQGWKGAGKNDILTVQAFDGAAWQTVYTYQGPNGGAHDLAWTSYAPAVAAHADGNPDFRLRWTLADVTNGNSGTETGWQLDNIVLSGDGGLTPPPAPVVVAHSPSGSGEDPQDAIYLEFSQPMDTVSFALGDVASFTGPSGAIAVGGFAWISDTLLRIDFASQSAVGSYTLVLAPTVLDDWGQELDQDTDDTPGEAGDDQYVAGFIITGNTAPTDLALSPDSIAENEPAGSTVGTLSTTDAEGGTFTYALVAGTGDADNASFSISGDQLLTAAAFDFETKSSYAVRVRTTDDGSLSFEKALTVTVTDVPEPPTAPTGLTATAVSSSGIDLSWTDTSGNEDGFKVQRAPAGAGPWSDVTTTAADATSFSDTGLAVGSTHHYRIIATNPAGDSAPGNTEAATTWTFAEAWRHQHFGQTANSGVAADDHDADLDGVINLHERAFVTVPTDRTSVELPVTFPADDGGTDYLTMSFRRRQGTGSGTTEDGYSVAGLTYTVEHCEEPQHGVWNSGSLHLQEVSVVDNLDGSDTVTVRSKQPLGSPDHEFLRVGVEPAP